MDTHEERRICEAVAASFHQILSIISPHHLDLFFLLLLLIYKLIYDQLILFCRCVVGLYSSLHVGWRSRAPLVLYGLLIERVEISLVSLLIGPHASSLRVQWTLVVWLAQQRLNR